MRPKNINPKTQKCKSKDWKPKTLQFRNRVQINSHRSSRQACWANHGARPEQPGATCDRNTNNRLISSQNFFPAYYSSPLCWAIMPMPQLNQNTKSDSVPRNNPTAQGGSLRKSPRAIRSNWSAARSMLYGNSPGSASGCYVAISRTRSWSVLRLIN